MRGGSGAMVCGDAIARYAVARWRSFAVLSDAVRGERAVCGCGIDIDPENPKGYRTETSIGWWSLCRPVVQLVCRHPQN